VLCRRSAVSAELKTCTPWSNKGGTDRLGVVKYLAIFEKGFAWGCSVHLEFRSCISQEVRTRERIW